MAAQPAHFGGVHNLDDLKRLVTLISSGNLSMRPEHIKSDNDKRASWGALGLIAYADRTFPQGRDEEFETMFGDLLTDLHHLADALRLDWGEMLAVADSRYEPELVGEL